MTYTRFINRLKKAHKCFTIWFNSIGVCAIAAILIEPSFVQYVSEHDLTIILTMGNIVLRFKTNSDMADK